MSEASSVELLALAKDDLAIARMIGRERLSEIGLGFHAQQAVEKAVKAVLAERGVAYPFSHDLTRLYEICEEQGLELPSAVTDSERLTPYAAAGRYGAVELPDIEPADALRWAALVIEWAEVRISQPAS